MITTTLRSVAAVLGLGVCTLVHAQYASSYTSPAKWNNFYPASLYAEGSAPGAAATLSPPQSYSGMTTASSALTAGSRLLVSDSGAEELASPEPVAIDSTQPESVASHCQDCGPAMASAGLRRLPLKRCFASFDLLFLDLANDSDLIVADGLGGFSTGAVGPSVTPGFEVELGRYLGDGRFGIGVGYFLWNPGWDWDTRSGAAGTIIPSMPGYGDISINVQGNGADTVQNYITGAGPVAGATSVRLRRDVFVQGIETNLYCFGLMGSHRVAYPGCNPAGPCGLAGRLHDSCYGYGGAAGPLTRPSSGRIRVMASHGFRWFQWKERMHFDYNVNGSAGFQEGDIYDCYRVENNLFGYQLGSQLTYCINSCWNLNVAGNFGIYGNRAERHHHIGSDLTAYRTGTTDLIDTVDSDSSLSTLGELDFGLGRRIGRAWTLRLGYRIMGITGVATAQDSITKSYATLASSRAVSANDSIVLHGGYVGLDYNW